MSTIPKWVWITFLAIIGIAVLGMLYYSRPQNVRVVVPPTEPNPTPVIPPVASNGTTEGTAETDTTADHANHTEETPNIFSYIDPVTNLFTNNTIS